MLFDSVRLSGFGSAFKARLQGFLSQRIPFLAYPYCIVPQLRTENFLYEHYCFKRLDIRLAKQMLKSPSCSLPGYTKGLVNFFSIRPLKNHTARFTRCQLYFQVFRIHHFLQLRQKFFVLCGNHISSPRWYHPADIYRPARHDLKIWQL